MEVSGRVLFSAFSAAVAAKTDWPTVSLWVLPYKPSRALSNRPQNRLHSMTLTPPFVYTTGENGSPGNALSMISKDGEEVAFKRPFSVADSGVKEWLKALETEMRGTLALLLREAVGATGDLSTSNEDAGVSYCVFVFFFFTFFFHSYFLV